MSAARPRRRGPRIIALAPGCPAGIGPEVTAAALAHSPFDDDVRFTFHGPASLLVEGARRARVESTRSDETVSIGAHAIACDADDGPVPEAGRPDARALAWQRDGLLRAIVAVSSSRAHALVTAPLRKAALQDVEGGPYPGQTELVHARLASDARPPLMAFVGGPFVLGLLTVHVRLVDVSRTITEPLVENAILRLAAHVNAARIVDDAHPARVVVLGVNPHAGEDGLLGDDERRVVSPTLARLRSRALIIDGPVPADGFFADVARPGFVAPDAVLAAHHDQGLAPYKLLSTGKGVNLTLGLRAPRTSPDHGTADAIAGRGIASPSSMIEAIAVAARLA